MNTQTSTESIYQAVPFLKLPINHLLRYAIPDTRKVISAQKYHELISDCALLETDLLLKEGKYYQVNSPTTNCPYYTVIEISVAALYQRVVENIAIGLKSTKNQKFIHVYYDESIKEKEIKDNLYRVRAVNGESAVIGLVKVNNPDKSIHYRFKFIK